MEIQKVKIIVFDRKKNSPFVEKVYGDRWISLFYRTTFGNFLLKHFLTSRVFSVLYGFLQDSWFSKWKIKPFIKRFSINMQEYESKDFQSFNEFFIRKFKEGQRVFPRDDREMGAFSEGRYFAYEKFQEGFQIPMKSGVTHLEHLFQNEKWSKYFQDGPLLISRLCPVDYHRFHFPCEGQLVEYQRLEGPLHSVNPLAIEKFPNLLIENQRDISIIESKNFGTLAMIEVGAICVGRIEQTHACFHTPQNRFHFKAGEEKGYFLFGGSTVVLVGQKDRWKPSQDLLENTKKGMETYLQLGDVFT